MLKLTRRQVRYWLFRFRTEADGGALADGAPDGLRAHFEAQEWFSAWKTFSLTWDVDVKDALVIVRVRDNPLEDWERYIAMEADDLPTARVIAERAQLAGRKVK